MELMVETHINRLRVKGSSFDPLATQLRAAKLLNAASLNPPGLPRSAILCIRRLRDPKPCRLRLWSAGTLLPRDWEEAVTESIGRIARQAARPVRGPVSSNAEAVLFQDRAELLACLAADWCDGSAASQWWWQSLFRDRESQRMVVQAWLESLEYAPAAMRTLAVQGKVAAFAIRLNNNDALALVRGIAQRFGLGELQAAIENPASGEEEPMTVAGERPADKHPLSFGSRKMPSPWQSRVPESGSPGLSFEQRTLIGISLMLSRAPAEVRKRSFAEAIRHWNAAAAADGGPGAKWSEEGLSGARSRSKKPDAGFAQVPSRHSGLGQESSDFSTKPLDSRFRGNDEHTGLSGAWHRSHDSRREGPVAGEDASSVADSDSGGRNILSMMQYRAMEAAQPGLLNETVIETELGGLFYLVNLGLYLGLYGDFTTPQSPGIDLSIWDFITLAGRRLVGETASDDPVWSLLAALAGRSDDVAPGAGFEPPDEWRLPCAWLESLPLDTAWRWTSDDDRLRLLHGEGFVVLDVVRTSEAPLDQLSREIKTYGQAVPERIEPFDLACQDPTHTPLEQWLDRLVPYVQARLRRALGTPDDEKVRRLLFRRRAGIRATETHVDVRFSLDDLPVDIRAAGLDRDPGWVPAAGRYVVFHYV